ncbi:hypothetical protein LCGC14_2127900 [marine sediment metagenome]|uniref:Uncharacterized protein n=1 Tax=marine sediment metagenome TaxID=412755 RepID=A0A0F9GFC7_9ZZZZ
MTSVDWQWKLNEAIDRLKYHYEHIGRKSGYPFLGIVYPPEMERAVLKEWGILSKSLEDEFDFRTIDILEVTHSVVESVGVDTIVENIEEPMPGSNSEQELGHMWVNKAAGEVTDCLIETSSDENKGSERKKVIVLTRLAALYPAATPKQLMHTLWNSSNANLTTPVVVLIPGTLIEKRVYKFVNKVREFMCRGDIL